jgi:ParB family transcriptional regulator, chromosome partitioning protein
MARKQLKFGVNPLLAGPTLQARERAGVPYREINLADIDVDPNQPRRDFESESLAELAASIKEQGLICPILVQVTDAGTYRVIAGERRLRAFKLLGRGTIPAIIDQEEEDGNALPKQLVENLQRVDLHPLERSEAIVRLRDKSKLSVRDIAAKLGVSKSAVQRALEIAALPEDLKDALARGASESKVLLLAEVKDRETRKALLAKIEDLSRREIEAELQKRRARKVSRRGTQSTASVDDRRIEEELQRALGSKVRILRKPGKEGQGSLSVEFYSAEDLRELHRKLMG